MNDREQDERLRTDQMAAAPGRTTQDVRDAANRAEAGRGGAPGMPPDQTEAALFPDQELNELRSRWQGIQTEFVDQPRRSVEEADGLVAQTIKRLADSFANARAQLEGQWARGSDVSTEDLRVALQRYRSFFDRLLAV